MKILGIWDGHDSGAALLIDGRLVAAINEERLTRRKLEVQFPVLAIQQCLKVASIRPADVDVVAASTSDIAKTMARYFPWTKERYYLVRRRKAMPGPSTSITRRLKYVVSNWRPNPVSTRLSAAKLRRLCASVGIRAPVQLFDHHECHAWGASLLADGRPAAILTIDGVGDGLSTTVSRYEGGRLSRIAATPASHSLGVFFEHVTTLLNMRELEDEGKVMALADYAAPIDDSANPLLALVSVKDARLSFSATGTELRRRVARVHWSHPNEQFAYMAQRVVERTCVDLAADAVRLTGCANLVVAGGVASNIKATRRMRQAAGVDSVQVFPHMGDGGLALGAAVAAAGHAGDAPAVDLKRLDYGPAYDDDAVESVLRARDLAAERPASISAATAELVAQGEVVMWFQDRMEFGPRALGQRSVLARPDRADLKDRLNLVLKRRVWYQPFCPSMLESEARTLLADWDGLSNPHMTMAYAVRPGCRPVVAGVMSVDGTCRPQVVPDEEKSRFADLLREVRIRTGHGVVLNTSFNIHGEPLVCRPEEAIDVFHRSGADALIIESFLVRRLADRR